MAIGFIKQGRKYKMSGADYYDKWRLSKIQYGADYIIEQETGFLLLIPGYPEYIYKNKLVLSFIKNSNKIEKSLTKESDKSVRKKQYRDKSTHRLRYRQNSAYADTNYRKCRNRR